MSDVTNEPSDEPLQWPRNYGMTEFNRQVKPSAIGDERLGKLLTHLVNKNRVGPTDLREEQVIGLGFVEQYIAALIEEQTKLARIDELARIPSRWPSAWPTSGQYKAMRVAELEASIKERSEDE